MSQKISSGVALTLIFVVAGTIALLLWLGNERGMRVNDPRLLDFEKPGENQNWLKEKNGNTKEEEDQLGDKNFCSLEAKECPDGSFVGRNADNNCEFDLCPEERKITNAECSSLGGKLVSKYEKKLECPSGMETLGIITDARCECLCCKKAEIKTND